MNFRGRYLLILSFCVVFGIFADVANAQSTILEIVADNTVAYTQPDVSSAPVEILKAGTKVVSSGKVSNYYEITTPTGVKAYIIDTTARPSQTFPPPAAVPVPPPVTSAPAAPPPAEVLKPKAGFMMGLILEKQLFLLDSMAYEKINIDFDYSDGDSDSYSFSGDSDMEPVSNPGFGLELGYNFKQGYVLLQGNLNKTEIKGKLKWNDKDADYEYKADDDYTITYQYFGLKGGFYVGEERGRPFFEGSLGISTAEFKFDDYNDMSFDNTNVIEAGFGGGYDYLIKEGLGIDVGGRLSVLGTPSPFKYSDTYSDYDYEVTAKEEIHFYMVPLSLFVRMYYVF